jgi:predicted ATPase/class 3 adenylate cyclase
MQCSACGFDNPDGMKFCGGCGTALGQACPTCGRDNPPGFRFCGYCGSPLTAGTASAADAPAGGPDASATAQDAPGPEPALATSGEPVSHGRLPAGAELRQISVMFCDLVGSTALSARLDPEELRDVVGAYQEACVSAIEANDGYVAQYLGDGILAYFGYPQALEREASRAVRAGLAAVRGVKRLSERLEKERGTALAVRIGIHTGVVVIGEVGSGRRREALALGETPNLAARIQAAAEPDTVFISGDTQRLVWQEFECEEAGDRELAGIPAPVHLFRVARDLAGELARRTRQGNPGPIVARQRELSYLSGHWERAREGSGQVVLIAGDAGIGKSSLVHAFAAALNGADAVRLVTRCLPYFRDTAYQPVVELVQDLLGCPAGEPPERKLHCLGGLLARRGMEEVLPLVASVLSLPLDGVDPGDARTRAQRKDRTRAALLRLLLAAADEGPLLLCVEDIHWADPSTLELLALLVRQVPMHRAMVVLTHRPEFQPGWGHAAHQSRLSLARLPQWGAEQIVRRLTGDKALPPEVEAQILEKTDGVPLFVEELTKAVLESGILREEHDRYALVGGSLPPLAIPATLHDSLEARLDRLATTKELAQVGAVLGREFTYALLRAVSDVEEAELRQALAQLVDAELLYQRGVPPEAVYIFKHALIQETAYQGLLKGVRQQVHHRAALALVERFPDEAEARPERVAQHYTAAGLLEQAVDAWTRAGRRAVERSAGHEAASHLRQGLELLPLLPAGPERDARELELRVVLGPSLTATLGHASAEVRETYLRALELARSLGVVDEHLEVMGGLFASYFVRSEVAEAFELAREMLRSAAARGQSPWEAPARVAVGIALLKAGTLAQARDSLEEGLRLYDPERHFALAHAVGQDFGVVAWCYSAFVHFALGDADEALARARRAAELARSLAHPHSLAMALSFNSALHFFRREPDAALEVLAEVEELTEREGFPHWAMDVPPMRAWALAAQGRLEEALALAAAVDLDALVAGIGTGPAMYRARMLAEAYLGAGRADLAEPLLERLQATLKAEAPEIWWRPEVHRAQAAALAGLGRADEARMALRLAAELSLAFGTPVFRVRALVDLARLNGALDDTLRAALDEACRSLSGVSEALAELREARELLAGAGAARSVEAEAVA